MSQTARRNRQRVEWQTHMTLETTRPGPSLPGIIAVTMLALAGMSACSPPPSPSGPRVSPMAQAACSELAEVMGVYRFSHVVRSTASVPHPVTGAPVPACRITEPEADADSASLLEKLNHDMTVRGWELLPVTTMPDATQTSPALTTALSLRRGGALCRVTSGSSASPGHTRLEAECVAETPS
ncbi:MAG: hypothetical protein OEW11_04455 [Nitrospirota bacterium]|nr:hypothetical protein [Nitrospirota bacterium]